MPRDDELMDLINAVVDGEATPDQQRQLDEILSRSPEAQMLLAETREIASQLDQSEREDPPADLKSEILAAIVTRTITGNTRNHHAAAAPASSGRKVLFGAIWAGIAAVILFVLLVSPLRLLPHRAGSESAATMAPRDHYDWPLVATFQSPAGDAKLMVRRDEDLLLLQPITSAPGASVLSVSWDPSALTMVALSGGRDASSEDGHVSYTLTPAAERAGVIVRARKGSRAAQVRVSVNSREVIRAAIPLM